MVNARAMPSDTRSMRIVAQHLTAVLLEARLVGMPGATPRFSQETLALLGCALAAVKDDIEAAEMGVSTTKHV
jgi:hypothetical protein